MMDILKGRSEDTTLLLSQYLPYLGLLGLFLLLFVLHLTLYLEGESE